MIRDGSGVLQPASWDESLKLIVDKIKDYREHYGAVSIAGYASSLCPNETLETFSKFMRKTVGTTHLDTLDGSSYRAMAKGISAFSKNGKGMEIESPLEAIVDADCVLVVGTNPLKHILWLAATY